MKQKEEGGRGREGVSEGGEGDINAYFRSLFWWRLKVRKEWI
jgi:hypothetical protein